jgi:hypothetical protein
MKDVYIIKKGKDTFGIYFDKNLAIETKDYLESIFNGIFLIDEEKIYESIEESSNAF